MEELYRTTLNLIEAKDADAEISSILKQQEAALQFLPNLYKAMANAPLMLKMYLNGYDLFRKETTFSPVEQEVIFLTISKKNECHYCVAAHSVIADHFSMVPTDVTDSIRSGIPIDDDRLEALRIFVQVIMDKKGFIAQQDAAAFLAAGYTEQHMLEVISALSVKVLSNYINHIFQTPVDAAFKSREVSVSATS